MHPVENKILNYLLDKYENSKLSRGENQRAIHIAFPFNKKTMPKYFDESSLEIETIHAAAEQMADRKVLQPDGNLFCQQGKCVCSDGLLSDRVELLPQIWDY